MNYLKQIFAILIPALTGAAAFFELKNKKLYYELIQESEGRQNALTNKIEELRGKKDSDSAEKADLIREDLKREIQKYKELTAK